MYMYIRDCDVKTHAPCVFAVSHADEVEVFDKSERVRQKQLLVAEVSEVLARAREHDDASVAVAECNQSQH